MTSKNRRPQPEKRGNMSIFTLNLPKHRLELRLVKRREPAAPLLPSLDDLKNTRSGSKFSRFFRHIFDHINIRKTLGANLAVMLLASSLIPTAGAKENFSNEPDASIIAEDNILLTTEKSIQYPVQNFIISKVLVFSIQL